MVDGPSAKRGLVTLLDEVNDIPRKNHAIMARHQLRDYFQSGIEKKVISVSAPAGYGKTTMVVDWISSRGLSEKVCWVNLSTSINTEEIFWSYLVSGI